MHGLRFPLLALGLLSAPGVRAGTLAFTPPSLDFGNVSVNGAPASATVTVVNSGSTTTIFGFVKTGGCTEFTVSAPGLPAVLPNGAALQLTVTYDPANRQADACTITSQDDNFVADSFPVSGDGTAAELSVQVSALAFADQPWASGTGQTLHVPIANVGEEPIADSNLGLALSTGVHFSAGAAIGLPIGPGEYASVPVTFDPVSAGAKSDLLTLSLDNDPPGSPNPTVSLSGTGLEENTGVAGPGTGAALVAGPSPTRGALKVSLAIPRPGRVRLEVRDVAGRAAVAARSFEASPGTRSLELRDGTDWSPATGVYFVRATLDGRPIGTTRVLVLR